MRDKNSGWLKKQETPTITTNVHNHACLQKSDSHISHICPSLSYHVLYTKLPQGCAGIKKKNVEESYFSGMIFF